MKNASRKTAYREKRIRRKNTSCQLCGEDRLFCWQCRFCSFSMCQNCMAENFWGLSCNGITWQCPDCGEQNGLGNQ